jgi:general secretion pathway protein G
MSAACCRVGREGFCSQISGRKGNEAVEDVRGRLKTTLEFFEIDCGRFPTTTEGLRLLVSPSTNVQNWHGPYLDPPVVPEDPWGNEYVYRFPGVYSTNGFDVYSLGPDGVSKTGGNDPDDIGNWEKPFHQSILKSDFLWEDVQVLPLIIPLLLGVRIIAGIVSQRVRAIAADNRAVDWIWVLISIVAILSFIMPVVVDRAE